MLNYCLIKGVFRMNLYRKLFLSFSVVVLIVGCSSKEEQNLMKNFRADMSYHKQLQQTEKAELRDANGSIVAFLTATYLYTPSANKHDRRDEKFIVGVEFEEPETNSIQFKNRDDINSTHLYSVTLEDKDALHVKKLSPSSKKLKDIPFVTEWGEYFEVTYPHVSRKRLSLVFKNQVAGSARLNFSKVARFVYSNKAF